MKKTILKQLIVMSRNTFYAIAINCTLCIIAYAENVKGQPNLEDITVSISVKDEELIKVFRLLEKKTPFSFTFNDVVIDPNAKITFSERNVTLYNLLYAISREQHLNFRRVNDNIHVTKAEENVNTPAVINQQAVVHITGVVRDKNGPLPGVSVLVKGTQTGTITDATGSFELDVEENAILQISFIGYRTQEVALGGQTSFDITLEEDVTSLNEVVVTAMGISRDKASLGYSVQQVGAEDVTSSGNSNLLDAVNGKLSGVQIQNSGGQPGSGTNVIIRGFSSISYSNQPLYVIDGIPISNEVVGGDFDGTTTSNRAIDIDPNTVETLTVLKGLAATSLYGIRAANGAIIITTKKGGVTKKKGLNVEYSYKLSTEKVNKLHEMTDKFGRGANGSYLESQWSWGPAVASNPLFPGAVGSGTSMVDLDGTGRKDVSGTPIPAFPGNYERFWKDGNTQKHYLAVDGGGENTNYYLGFSSLDQTGIIPTSTYDKYSFVTNLNTKLSERVSLSTKLNYINTGGNRVRERNGLMLTWPFWPNILDVNAFPWKDANGDKTWYPTTPHPQWVVNEDGEKWRINRFIGNVRVGVEVAKWMNISWNLGLDTFGERRSEIRPIGSGQTPNQMGDISEFRLTSSDVTSDFIVSGTVPLSDKLEVSYIAGNNFYQWNQDNIIAKGTSFVLRDFLDISNTIDQNIIKNDDGRILIGAYGGITLGYNHMLYLGFTGRNDWSSTLPSNNNSFFYPSVNLGFIASEILNAEWLSFLKLRASLAKGANDAPTQSLRNVFVKNDPNVFGRPRFSQSLLLRNPNLRPEKTTETEVGFESIFLQNKIGLDFSYYNRLSEDQIIQVPVSTAMGFTNQLDNLGTVRNKGVEITLSINDPIKFRDLKWNTNFNFTRNVGRVEKIADGRDRVILGGSSEDWAQALVIAIEGQQLGALYDYPYQRYGVTENDPNYLAAPIVVGANGLPLRGGQRVLMGNVNPDWILGISSNLKYKGASFGFTLERKQGGDVVNGFGAILTYSGKAKITEERFYPNDANVNSTRNFGGVYQDGTPNNIEAPLTNAFWGNTYRRVGENNIEDASWWRLRNIYIGYSLPKAWLSKMNIQDLEFTFTARNAWLKTGYSGNDPEISANGVGNIQGFDDFMIPNTKSFEIGARVKF
ncbi:MAG TPA: SusC/RagA family TonB-linked outer membrane protein [Cyclobacteriaceae bacterium]|nr:SusC/RagA family TonB-linked outer membrane protein [Cyclobacteriaceae bacterium]